MFIQFKTAFQGTGSKPEPPHGWQRKMRFIASHRPFAGPYFVMASTAYSEQVGLKRQVAGVNGLMQRR